MLLVSESKWRRAFSPLSKSNKDGNCLVSIVNLGQLILSKKLCRAFQISGLGKSITGLAGWIEVRFVFVPRNVTRVGGSDAPYLLLS